MRWFLVVLWVLLLPGFVRGTNVTLEVKLPEELMLGQVYTSLFNIKNLDYKRGMDSFVNVTIYYSVQREDGSIYYDSNFSKVVNSYTYANTGYLFMDELGKFQLCGWVEPENRSSCSNFSVIDPMSLPCAISIGLDLEKEIYSNNERVDFKNILVGNDDDHPFILEYWIEDLLGNTEKKPVNTSNLNEKTFTPGTDELDRVYVIKNKLVFIGCNNSNLNLTSERRFAIKNQDYSKSDVVAECTAVVQSKKKAVIASFYTRTKKYHEEINIYANVKSEYPTLLLLKGGAKDEWRKINSSDKLAFSVRAVPGVNYYELEAYVNDLLQDKKSLVVVFDGAENKTNEIIQDAEPINDNIPNETMKIQKNTSVSGAHDLAINVEPAVLNKSITEMPSTGRIVYESPREKANGIIGYLAVGVIALAGFGIFVYNRR